MNDILPKSWQYEILEKIVLQLLSGKRPKGGVRNILSGTLSIGGEHVSYDGKVILNNPRYVPDFFAKTLEHCRIKANDILIVKDGATTGKSALADESIVNAVINEHVFIVRPCQEIEEKWLFYYLWSQKGLKEILKDFRGTAQGGITKNFVNLISLPVAPVNEQGRIVDRIERLFTDLDRGEALLKIVRKQLATYRQSVLKAAVTGELTKDWREENKYRIESGEKLLARILEFQRKNWKGRGKYKEPEGPNINQLLQLPKEWVWSSGDQLFTWSSGKFLPAKKIIEGKVPVYGGNGVNAYHKEALINFTTLVVGRVGAHCGNIHITEPNSWVTDNAIFAVTLPKDCNLNFLAHVLLTAKLGESSKGGAQPFVNQDSLKKCLIPLPSPEEQVQIVDRVNEIFSQINAFEALCKAELKRSAILRQSILKSAFSGKLVAQDPADEPASELLARIKAGNKTEPKIKTKVKKPPMRRRQKLRSDKKRAA